MQLCSFYLIRDRQSVDTVERSENEGQKGEIKSQNRNDETLMSWQTDGPLKYQPSCMRTRMEKNWTSVGTWKKMAYNPKAHTDTQQPTCRPHANTHTKKTVSKLTWWASATHPLLTVYNIPSSFLPLLSTRKVNKRKLVFAIAGITSASHLYNTIFP